MFGSMASLWELTGPTIPTDSFTDGTHVDIVVVGAGLTGLATAVLLARSGLSVLIAEARHVGAVTTGNSTAKLSLLQGTTYSEILRHSNEEVLWAYTEANREGAAWLLHQLVERGVDVPRAPSFVYANGADGASKLNAEYAALQRVGLPVQRVGSVGLPFEVAGALRLDDQALLQPLEVLAVLASEFRARGGKIVERCRVQRVDSSSDSLAIETTRGRLTAHRCVLATGTPILDRSFFFARVEPSRSFVAAYVLHTGEVPPGMHVSIDTPARSLRPARDAAGRELLVVGGDSHVPGRADDTFERITELDTWVEDCFGSCERVTWWGAQDYRTNSRIPFAGSIPGEDDRVYAATGYNKWGMSNAIASTLRLTAEILGGNLEWGRTLTEHSMSIATAQSAVAVNASVAGHLLADWVEAELRPSSDIAALREGEGALVREGLAPVGAARIDGHICKVTGICTHMGGILSWNELERTWDCPLHGSRFTHDGIVLEGPAVEDLKKK